MSPSGPTASRRSPPTTSSTSQSSISGQITPSRRIGFPPIRFRTDMIHIRQLFEKTRASAVVALLGTLFFAAPSWAEVEIQEVTSDKGIKAWLVEDYTVPIVTVRFSCQGGNTQDPVGKEGLSNLMSALFD